MSESKERKARSINILNDENVPVFHGLPSIETELESLRRSETEIVQRLVALAIVAVKAETTDDSWVKELIADFSAEDFFTPLERGFISTPDPTKILRQTFLWRYECVNVLLWSVGHVSILPRPDRVCDTHLIAEKIKNAGVRGLLADAKLKRQSDLLDAADLIYRYHWAVRDAQINARPVPSRLNSNVVFERHHSLNWLIGYGDEEWDDISTDT